MIKRHSPPHIYADDTIYFITARCYNQQEILNTDQRRTELLHKIHNELKEYYYILYAYIILLNHYHLLIKSDQGRDMERLFRYIHGGLSARWNKDDRTPGRKVWQNYFDKTVKNEADFYRHLNYIHHNPIKHFIVKNMGDWKWSSYNQYKKKYGLKWLADCFARYPIVDFSMGEGEVM